MDLANTYYVIGIICMSLITIILIALIIVGIVIKLKIDHIHRMIEERIAPVKDFAQTAKHIAKAAKETFSK